MTDTAAPSADKSITTQPMSVDEWVQKARNGTHHKPDGKNGTKPIHGAKAEDEASFLLCVDETLPPAGILPKDGQIEYVLHWRERQDLLPISRLIRQQQMLQQPKQIETTSLYSDNEGDSKKLELAAPSLSCSESELPPLSDDISLAFPDDEMILTDVLQQKEWEESWSARFKTLQFPKGKKRKRAQQDAAENNKSTAKSRQLAGEKAYQRNKPRRDALLQSDRDFLDKYAPMLRYSWDDILWNGKSTSDTASSGPKFGGSRAYNRALQLTSDHPPLPPGQIQQTIAALRPRTVPLPPDLSFLRNYAEGHNDITSATRLSTNTEDENIVKNNNGNNNADNHKDPFQKIGELYVELCRQDADIGFVEYKQKTNHWSASSIPDHLRALNQECDELQTRQREVMERASSSGFVTEETWTDAFRLLGVRAPSYDSAARPPK